MTKYFLFENRCKYVLLLTNTSSRYIRIPKVRRQVSPAITNLKLALWFSIRDVPFARSRAKTSWTYTGCSHHKVPLFSKVEMRSECGTKTGKYTSGWEQRRVFAYGLSPAG